MSNPWEEIQKAAAEIKAQLEEYADALDALVAELAAEPVVAVDGEWDGGGAVGDDP